MSAAEHIKESLDALDALETCTTELEPYWIARAQVHATLAVAAATMEAQR